MLAALGARFLAGPRTIDDAYITFRYARNLLAGNGLVYNPGEWVLGTTTPLYTLLMAALGAIFGGVQAPFPEIAWSVNAGCDALACGTLILLGFRMKRPSAGYAAALIWAIAPMSVTFAIGGMETSLFILLMLATFYFHSSAQTSLAAASSALSILVRPDALLFVLPLYLERLRQLRWIPTGKSEPIPISWKEILSGFVPLAAWFSYAWLRYGSPLPHSITAKASAYQLPGDAAFIRLLQHYATPFLGHLTFGTPWIGVGLILFPALLLVAARRILRKDVSLWPLFAFPFIYFLAYAIANPLIFRWYLTPPLPLFMLGIFLGTANLAEDLKFPPLQIILPIAAAGMTLNGWVLHPDHGPDRPAPAMAYIQLELLYQLAAEELFPQLESGDVVAAGDIGALGYFTDAVILDTLGLISPQADDYYPLPAQDYVINFAIPADLILDENPDFLVALEVYGRRTFLQNEDFLSRYYQFETLPTDIYGSQGMLLYRAIPNRRP